MASKSVLLGFWMACAFAQPQKTEPRLTSVYPSAGQRGASLQVEFRGVGLDKARLVWAEGNGIAATVRAVELAPGTGKSAGDGDLKKAPPLYSVRADLAISGTARAGAQWLRVVTPLGVSSAIRFVVTESAVRLEPAGEPVTLPNLFNGRLSHPGESDLYAFQAIEGQEFNFQVSNAENFEPRLTLFRDEPGWFQSGRPRRILFDDERDSDLMATQARGTFRAAQPGRYLLEVSSLFGKGSPDCTYQIRMETSRRTQAMAPGERGGSWRERTFARALSAQWIEAVAARSMTTSPKQPLAHARDQEPAALIPIPALLEGAIGRPGEVDSFRFRVEAGQKLAFEIETPRTLPPHFNPRLSVHDDQKGQLFASLQRRISMFNNNAEVEVYLKDIESKVIHSFQSAGAYLLQIRDITARYGNDSYAYRILVRPQIPHVGEVSSPDLDHINLELGKATRLSLTASLEEGFTGEVVYWLTGLPVGVTAYPAGRVIEERAARDLPDNAETVLPVSYVSTLVITAGPDAEPTTAPQLVKLYCRPVLDGIPGPELLVKEFPIMLVER